MISTAAPWEKQPDGTYRCLRHGGANFTARQPCAQCDFDPGPPLDSDIDKLPEAPLGCLQTTELEADANVVRALASSVRDELLELANVLGRQMTSISRSKVKSKKFFREYADLAEARTYALGEVRKQGDLQLKAIRTAAMLAVAREDLAIVNAREKRMADRARGAGN